MTDRRTNLYLKYCIEQGAVRRWGPNWESENFDRRLRLMHEVSVIEGMHFESYFLILKRILDFCREQQIVYGPGRGSVGGSLAAHCLGIHEIDPLEYDLSFERFLNPSRVAFPDVDLDVSQRHRPRVLEFIRTEFEDETTVVLQVPAFARAGARRTIDMVAAAKRQDDPNAESIAVQLKKLLPEGANVTGGTKQDRELAWWLEFGRNKNQAAFIELANRAGWMDTLLALDGVQTHLAKHAAGVVIMSREDLKRFPQTGARDSKSGNWNMMIGYDMYMLDELGCLKIDILGLRTLDIVSDAHKFCGGSGATPELMDLWRLKRDSDDRPYELLCRADTTGVFQVETSGYRRTLKEFQPHKFDHIVQLNALYRPGALDSKRESDGKALALDTPIPTPRGWAVMGDLRRGDRVFDELGRPCSVLATTPVMVNRDCYQVVFSDGSVITADAEHTWQTSLGSYTTEQIYDKLAYWKRRRQSCSVVNAQPLRLRPKSLLLDPYVLGLWLGDGWTYGSRLHTNSTEAPYLLAELKNVGLDATVEDSPGSPWSRVAQTIKFRADYELRQVGVFGQKHIPHKYLRSSVSQRTALLQGLMDSDGHIDQKGRAEITTKSTRLRDDVLELLCSLGFKPAVSLKIVVPTARSSVAKRGTKLSYGPYYRISFRPDQALPVVRLPHKQERLVVRAPQQSRRRRIVAVEPVDSVPVRCIQVDSSSGLYLAGQTMIPTHNSMVEIFIDRLHHREPITYPAEVQGVLSGVLDSTQGIYLYQEQSMKLARLLAGFTETEADNLRKAIGKKQLGRMTAIKPQFLQGMMDRGYSKHAAETQWGNIEASSRYAWNLCLAEGTLIPTQRGVLSIEDVVAGDEVLSVDGGLGCQRVAANHDNGLAETLRVVLQNGQEIVGTPHHQLFAEQGCKQIDQLISGERLYVAHDLGPSAHIKPFACVVTGVAERDEIPGWAIVYPSPRDDMVYWQFVPSQGDLPPFGHSTDLADAPITRANTLFKSVRPGKIGAAWVTSTLTGVESERFFCWAQTAAETVADGGPMQAQAVSDFCNGPILLEVESLDFRQHIRRDLSMAITDPTVRFEEPGESSGAALETKTSDNLLITPSGGVEGQNGLLALFQLREFLKTSGVVEDEAFRLALDPSVLGVRPGSYGSRLPTSAFAEFWNVCHKTIVPRLVSIDKIEPAGQCRVFDLEMPALHNFVANGIVSHNSHSVFYGTITWWTALFKAIKHIDVPELGLDGPGTAGFYAALINSLDEDKERQADAIAEARQHVEIKPPDINVADESYTVSGDAVVFGLNGIKGMGEANRAAIILERMFGGPFKDFEDFHRRLPSVPINMKLSLIQCGAFDSTDGREKLLAVVPRQGPGGAGLLDKEGNPKTWTVAECIKHNSTLKKPRELPDITSWRFPTENELAEGEMQSIGFYVSADPMADVNRTLKRLDSSSHWGGEVVKGTIRTKPDKNGNEMAWFTLLTNSLNKRRCVIFASNWSQCKPLCVPGKRVIARGHLDSSQLLVDALFEPGRFDHFKVMCMSRNGEKKIENFDGLLSTIELAEASGFEVQLI